MISKLLKISLLISVFSIFSLVYAYDRGTPERIGDSMSLPNFMGPCPGGRCSVIVEENGYVCIPCDYGCNYCTCIPQDFYEYEATGNCVVIETTIPLPGGGSQTITEYECRDLRYDEGMRRTVTKSYCFLVAG